MLMLKRIIPAGTIFLSCFIGGMATGRVLYEVAFPGWLWLARPEPNLLLGLLGGTLGWWWWQNQRPDWSAVLPFLPLLLNSLTLFSPTVDLLSSRFWWLAGWWLMAVLFRPGWSKGLLLAGLLAVYLLTMGRTVGRADTFEFQVVTPVLGIVHPTGYPLWLLLGKLFTFIPAGNMAWRVNLATVTYGLLTALVVYRLVQRLTGQEAAGLLAALALALAPTFWSQAIEAEVYTLHTLFVAVALLWLTNPAISPVQTAAWLGFGLTNHLTTLFLLPPAGVAFYHLQLSLANLRRLWWRVGLAFSLPLALYLYLPLRWQAVNGEPMGWQRFIDWVVGGRFQDALQWRAWLDDPTRYQVVGRLLGAEWSPAGLLLALFGLLYLFRQQKRVALLLGLTWLGYTFYALNYYVPDLAVFLLPAHLVMAVWMGIGLYGLGEIMGQPKLRPVLTLVIFGLVLGGVPGRWLTIDRSADDGRQQWGRAVLALPLANGAAILADSEKFPPLYYLQQAEALRPDLDIVLLPDEAAYRAELDRRLAEGQTVYLARFLPGLEGTYHLNSMGPLLAVQEKGLSQLPAGTTPTSLLFGNLTLRGYQLEPTAAIDPAGTALTLYWQANAPAGEALYVYTRWANGQSIPPAGQHPANNHYPTVAWKGAELVADFHWLPRPLSDQPLPLQVAIAPPFTRPEQLQWQTVTTFRLSTMAPPPLPQPLRSQIGPTLLTGLSYPTQVRPQSPLTVTLAGCNLTAIKLSLQPIGAVPAVTSQLPMPSSCSTKAAAISLATDLSPGRYQLVATSPGQAARCHWFGQLTDGCVLGELEISGLVVPAGATNFADKIALLTLTVPETTLRPGGQLPVNLTWQALAPLSENYTLFVQVLDSQDQIVGQVDSWPLQGTFPTSQWQSGQLIQDPYTVPLKGELAPGPYRLIVGWYLLATLERLAVVDPAGNPINDKVVLPGLIVP